MIFDARNEKIDVFETYNDKVFFESLVSIFFFHMKHHYHRFSHRSQSRVQDFRRRCISNHDQKRKKFRQI